MNRACVASRANPARSTSRDAAFDSSKALAATFAAAERATVTSSRASSSGVRNPSASASSSSSASSASSTSSASTPSASSNALGELVSTPPNIPAPLSFTRTARPTRRPSSGDDRVGVGGSDAFPLLGELPPLPSPFPFPFPRARSFSFPPEIPSFSLSAYRSVFIVCSAATDVGATCASSTVLLFAPTNASRSTFVSCDPLNGTWRSSPPRSSRGSTPSDTAFTPPPPPLELSARMHSFSASNDLLISAPSWRIFPSTAFPRSAPRSLPAKSTRDNRLIAGVFESIASAGRSTT
eukprot:31333-Pelagococcus_subviridis.AAC.11